VAALVTTWQSQTVAVPKSTANNVCNGINAIAREISDWGECALCQATGYHRNKECPNCKGVGYIFVSGDKATV
jgi:hypothetical protein